MFKKSFFIALVMTGFVQAAQRQARGFRTPIPQVQAAKPSANSNLPMTQAEIQEQDRQLKRLDQQRKVNQDAERAAARK